MMEFWQGQLHGLALHPLSSDITNKGYILGSEKVKSFAGLASNDFAIKALLYRNRSSNSDSTI
jgi:hypothetical protein